MTNDLAPFFSPKGVAIIGASTNPRKLSHGILKNLSLYGFEGGIYPVNPGADQILGLKSYPEVALVPDPVDLAVVVLPAPMTPKVLRDCGDRGIKAVIIISGGFREIGDKGLQLEQECSQIASEYGMRLIGPNCVGTMDLHTGLNTTFIEGVPDKGSIGFLSQSGAVCGGVVDYIANKHIGFSHFASLGNELDVDETDMIAYFGEHPQVKVIAAYVEGIQDGQKFLEVASQVSKEKPIVLLKAGRSDAGARAVSSHTGSLAGAYTAYQAAFKQAGVIEVPDLASLFDVAWALSCQSLPEGNRVAIFTNAGGPAALASDSLAANGFTLANIGEEKQKQLAEKLNPSAQVSNPVDMLGGAEPAEFSHCLSTLLDDPGVDAFLPILVPQALVDPGDVARAIVENANKTQKTVLACMVGEKSLDEARMVLHKNNVPMTIFPEVPGQVLGAMAKYKTWKDKLKSKAFSFSDINCSEVARALSWINKTALGEADTRPILEAYGMTLVPGGFAKDFAQAAAIAEDIGYPVALKVVSEQILHKSDLGGIALNIDSDSALKNAIKSIKEKIAAAAKDAAIDGYLVEKMAPKGLEVIVGMRRDPTFGPLMMFGLGGVYVELFKDVGFGVAPLSPEYAKEMIFSTKAGRLLQGFRGGPVYDLDAVVDVIGRLSQLSLDFPQVSEIEINPLLVLPEGEGAFVLDARMILADK
ncbi:MAG: acetate--CoA ligase family protein [Brevefilum sp.]|nr:acetate--CoA ligase family protein [Brevefilum sp.]MDW7754145.1 acetate--CoA ligase family protein [Brevefilum sp.]